MQRARIEAVGWERDLGWEPDAAELPPPTGKLVNIAVEACGVCYRDIIDRSGRYAFLRVPITPGHEAVGRVTAVGAEVTRWRVGDRVGTLHRDGCGECDACRAGETSLCPSAAFVFGILADGGYASALAAPESALYRVPEVLPAVQAAPYHCTFGTAWRGLTSAGAAAGQRVLVTGANGGVGCAAVQLAARLGAEVIAVVRREEHVEALRGLGAHEVIVDSGGEFHKRARGIDVALECVGQPTFNSSLRSLRLGGRIVIIGNVVVTRAELNLGYVIVNALRIIGSSGATAADMTALFAAGAPLPLPVDRALPLSRADEAQRLVRAGGVRGRIVLSP
jgi:D-arabinose 1-dehydrogenase-like Zn-dependent alcohol dehydrogenase